MMEYAIKHKESKLFFSGFEEDFSAKWDVVSNAKNMDFQHAKEQALLLRRIDCNVQAKPVAI